MPPVSAIPTTFAGAIGVLGSIQYANTNAGEITSDHDNFNYSTAVKAAGVLSVNNIATPTNGSVPKIGSGVSAQTGDNCVAIGVNAGASQAADAIALGHSAGAAQTDDAIAVGHSAGATQAAAAIAVGLNAGNSQAMYAVAVGRYAGAIQAASAVALGNAAGAIQAADAIAIGTSAGRVQASNTVAVGAGAGYNQSGEGAIAIGTNAAWMGGDSGKTQGIYSIVIGHNACATAHDVPASTIVLDANNGGVPFPVAAGFFVDPVADLSGAAGFVTTVYNPSTKEFRYVAKDTEIIAAFYDMSTDAITLGASTSPTTYLTRNISRLVACSASVLGVVTFQSVTGIAVGDEIFAQVYLNTAAVGIPMRVVVPNIAYLNQVGQITVSFNGNLIVGTNKIDVRLYSTSGAGIATINGSLAIQSGMMVPPV